MSFLNQMLVKAPDNLMLFYDAVCTNFFYILVTRLPNLCIIRLIFESDTAYRSLGFSRTSFFTFLNGFLLEKYTLMVQLHFSSHINIRLMYTRVSVSRHYCELRSLRLFSLLNNSQQCCSWNFSKVSCTCVSSVWII